MKSATIHEIKQELGTLPAKELVGLCLRLARFKKENKELLTYLLYEAHNEDGYIQSVKQELDVLFKEINLSQLYFAKKSLRKIARVIGKYCRYSGNKATETDLRLYFCASLQGLGIDFRRNQVISNLYNSQLKKAAALLETLHEDIQYDYRKILDTLPPVPSRR